MRTFLLGAVATLGLAFGAIPATASAYWATRTAYRFDPLIGTTVAYQESFWVPDVVAVPAATVYPAPVYYSGPAYRVYPRAYYYSPAPLFPAPAVNFYFRYRR